MKPKAVLQREINNRTISSQKRREYSSDPWLMLRGARVHWFLHSWGIPPVTVPLPFDIQGSTFTDSTNLDRVVFGRCLVKKPTCKWTHTVQTCVIQSTVTSSLALWDQYTLTPNQRRHQSRVSQVVKHPQNYRPICRPHEILNNINEN